MSPRGRPASTITDYDEAMREQYHRVWRAAIEAAGPVRYLVVRPPWSWAMAWGGKVIENRAAGALRWKYRGLVFIQHGCTWSKRGADDWRVRAAWRGIDLAKVNPGISDAPIGQVERIGGLLMPFGDMNDHQHWIEPGAVAAKGHLVDIHPATTACVERGGSCWPWGEIEYQAADGSTTKNVSHLVFEDVQPLIEQTRGDRGGLGLLRATPDTIEDVLDPWRWGQPFHGYA